MNLKAMIEKRNAKLEEMQEILSAAQTETRAFTTDEETKYDSLKEEIRSLDATIKALEETADMEERELPTVKETVEQMETRAFENYLRGQVSEIRAGEQNLTMGNNGAVIPTTIADRIIRKVTDISPILQRATIYNVKGTLKVPVWGLANSHDIKVGYQAEFTEMTADSGKFTSVDLGGYLAGALTLVGKSVINNAGVDIVSFVVDEMAEKIAIFLDQQLLVGTGSNAAQGITSCSNTITTAAATAITADELIKLQAQVKQAYQANACWIFNPETFTVVKQLKDNNNRYLLQDNVSNEFPYMLLGKPVFLSDNMPKIAANAKTVVYGDLSGLSVNFRENIEIQLLQEKYATQHAVGVCAWFEFDSKVTDSQRVAVMVQKSA